MPAMKAIPWVFLSSLSFCASESVLGDFFNDRLEDSFAGVKKLQWALPKCQIEY